MTLHEIFESSEQLDEGVLQNIIAAASLAIAILPTGLLKDTDIDTSHARPTIQSPDRQFVASAVSRASMKYHVNPNVVRQAVKAALKYQYADFPTAKDILAVVGTESNFHADAKSKLKHDPAIGLMQVRPISTGVGTDALRTVDGQIKVGAHILRTYYEKLGDKNAALHAYNVGLTNHKTHKVVNPRYAPKVNKEREMYNDI